MPVRWLSPFATVLVVVVVVVVPLASLLVVVTVFVDMAPGAEVLRVVSTDDKVQRVPIAARKREAGAPSAPSSLLTAEQRKAATAPATSPAATGAAKVEEKPKPSLRTRLMGAK